MKKISGTNLNKDRAKEIADLINDRNKLTRKYTASSLKSKVDDPDFKFLIETDEDDYLIGVIEVQKVQWYQCEIRHLAVKQNHSRKGIGSKLIFHALQESIKFGASIAQCTIRNDNSASASAFNKYGFVVTTQFVNKDSGNIVRVYQVDLTKKDSLEIKKLGDNKSKD